MRWFSALTFAALTFATINTASAADSTLALGILADEPAPTVSRLLSERLSSIVEIEVRVFDDSSDIEEALREERLDLAIVEEPTRDISGVGVISNLYPSVLHVLVDSMLSPQDLPDVLSAGGLWAGSKGGQGHTLAQQLADDYALGDIDLLPDPWSRQPRAYFIFGGLLAPDALSRLGGFNLYSLDDIANAGRGSVAEAIVIRYPNLRTFILPAELYPTLSQKPALTVAVNNLLVGRSGLDADLAYQIAMATHRLQPEIAAVYPLAGLEELSRNSTSARSIPLHSGAQRFVDREKPGLIERYAEFVGAAVTASIAFVTLVVALYRRRRQARKDRLDSYYQKALEYRDKLQLQDQPPEQVALELRAMQREVFDLLVVERIDADAALLAFLTLSNQLLGEAQGLSSERGTL